jgi:hypothetical protein
METFSRNDVLDFRRWRAGNRDGVDGPPRALLARLHYNSF